MPSTLQISLTEKTTVPIVSTKAPVKEATYRLIDFFTLELVLLASLVLLALVVLIARKSRTG
jgi:hypothetical protein